MNKPLGTPELQIQELAKQIRALEVAGRSHLQGRVISSGCAAIDRGLPGGGYAAGSLVEWIGDRSGSGATSLALNTARQAIAGGKYLLVIDRERTFYPPAALALGIPLEQLIVVHPASTEDFHWAIDQGLRCSAMGAVMASLEELDDRVARRLQLAAEQGGGLGLFLRKRRSPRQVTSPSWAEIQWQVIPSPSPTTSTTPHRRFELHLLRCRGGRAGMRWSLMLDATTLNLTEVSLEAVSPETRSRHAAPSTLCLAAELALSTDAPTRAEVGRSTVRAASA
jgi:protein ImuA